MIIDLNTEQLQAAVQIARSANAAISDAANLLNTVVIHTDWQCPERTEINDNTARNRSQALTLQADAEQLYNTICYAADAFLVAEQEVANSFNTVDGPIASFLSRVPGGSGMSQSADHATGGAPAQQSGSKAWDLAKDVLEFAGGGVRTAMQLTNPLVSFDAIADALKNE